MVSVCLSEPAQDRRQRRCHESGAGNGTISKRPRRSAVLELLQRYLVGVFLVVRDVPIYDYHVLRRSGIDVDTRVSVGVRGDSRLLILFWRRRCRRRRFDVNIGRVRVISGSLRCSPGFVPIAVAVAPRKSVRQQRRLTFLVAAPADHQRHRRREPVPPPSHDLPVPLGRHRLVVPPRIRPDVRHVTLRPDSRGSHRPRRPASGAGTTSAIRGGGQVCPGLVQPRHGQDDDGISRLVCRGVDRGAEDGTEDGAPVVVIVVIAVVVVEAVASILP
mmetsp:Transcript_32837/g.60493  ORF Transcript_32837/g.60493 Transcript_32837/m.60493 type:complete len:274 (-) Transcript_32837:935-1756(-)